MLYPTTVDAMNSRVWGYIGHHPVEKSRLTAEPHLGADQAGKWDATRNHGSTARDNNYTLFGS